MLEDELADAVFAAGDAGEFWQRLVEEVHGGSFRGGHSE